MTAGGEVKLLMVVMVYFLLTTLNWFSRVHIIASSQTVYFLFKVRRARMIKNKNRRGFIDLPRKGITVEEEENSSLFSMFRNVCLS